MNCRLQKCGAVLLCWELLHRVILFLWQHLSASSFKIQNEMSSKASSCIVFPSKYESIATCLMAQSCAHRFEGWFAKNCEMRLLASCASVCPPETPTGRISIKFEIWIFFEYLRLRCCATNWSVAGSIPAGVIGILHWDKILPIAVWPWGRLSL